MAIVTVTQEMRTRCFNFASNIINGDDQYNRLPATLDVRIERTYVGKLAEYAFLLFLRSNHINYPENDMFEIYAGAENTDDCDFITSSRETIDIKCASKPNHSRIMVPIDQFNNIPKDFYVGIKLNSRLNDNGLIITDSITQAQIYGYCTYVSLQRQQTRNFGEGPCKSEFLSNLQNIDTLIERF